jgi:glycosyltransferase involved in cell wall biosynthesis
MKYYNMTEFIFWFCALGIFYIYLGYPILIRFLSLFTTTRVTVDRSFIPKVTILIAAYNEEKDIRATIQNKIDLDYPQDKLEIIVVSDESTDDTDAIVESFSGAKVSVKLVRQIPRQGKTAGLNLIVPDATGEVLVFSDANSIYQTDALYYLVDHFNDPIVGYVTGKMIYVNSDGAMIGDGCSAYMKYENWIRSIETNLGSVVGVDGGIDAMRKSLYESLNADQLPDFVQPLKVVQKGFRVTFEPKAILKEESLSSFNNEYTMRVRVTLRALWALKDMCFLLNPFKYGLFSFQLLSHKLLRYLAFVPILGVFILNLFLLDEGIFYLLTLGLQVTFYILAWLGKSYQNEKNVPVYYTLPYYFTLLNFASLHAVLRFLKGEKQVIWKPRVG